MPQPFGPGIHATLTCLENRSRREYPYCAPASARGGPTFTKKLAARFSLAYEGPVFPLRRGSEAASSW